MPAKFEPLRAAFDQIWAKFNRSRPIVAGVRPELAPILAARGPKSVKLGPIPAYFAQEPAD